MTDKKPLPTPCQKCGAAVEHGVELCRYCRGDASGRRSYEFRKSGPFGPMSTMDSAMMAFLYGTRRRVSCDSVYFGDVKLEGVKEIHVDFNGDGT